MKYFISLLSLFSLFFLYQNCAGPVQDIGEVTSTDACLEEPQLAGLSSIMIDTLTYEVSLSNVSGRQIDRVDWFLHGDPSGSTPAPNKVFTFDEPGIHEVNAIAYNNACNSPQFVTENGSVDAAPDNCDNINISAENLSMSIGETKVITLNNSSAIKNNTIEWLKNEDVTARGQTTFNFNPDSSGTYQIKARAEAQNSSCGIRTSNTLNISVNEASSINTTAELVLNPNDGICNVSSNGDSNCNVSADVNSINNLASGHKIRLHFKDPSEDDYSLNAIACFVSNSDPAVNIDWTPLGGRRLKLFVDTNDSCSAYSNKNQMEEQSVALNVEADIEARCGENLYLNNNRCESVTKGYYSKIKNNSRIGCSNEKPSNANYSGPGTDGTNNCPWECHIHFEKDGNQCVSKIGRPSDPRNAIQIEAPSTCQLQADGFCPATEVTIDTRQIPNWGINWQKYIQVHVYDPVKDEYNQSPFSCMGAHEHGNYEEKQVTWIKGTRTFSAFYVDNKLDNDTGKSCTDDLPQSYFRNPYNHIKSVTIEALE